MNSHNKKIKRAKERMDSFEPRSDKCPICSKGFRHGCTHSVVEAHDRLFQNYVKVIAQS